MIDVNALHRNGRFAAVRNPDGLAEIRRTLEALTPIPEDEWEFVAAARGLRVVKKREHLMQIGDDVRHLYFIHEGALRVYYMADGVEHTRSFAFENRFYTNSYSFLTGLPSQYAVEALEDTVLSSIPRAVIEASRQRHVCWERVARILANRNFIEKEKKEMEMRTCTAEERYRRMIERNSPILQRVPLYHIASFLGITPETLSRIRSRIR